MKTPTEKAEEFCKERTGLSFNPKAYGDQAKMYRGYLAGHTEGRREALEMAQGLVEALAFYTYAGKTQTVRGQIIEYDVDAGPLYDYYEVPMTDDGTMARQAIAKFEEWKDGK